MANLHTTKHGKLVSRAAEAKAVFLLDNVEGLWDVLILHKNVTGIPLDFDQRQAINCFLVSNS